MTTANNENKKNRKTREDRILLIVIVLPIAIALLVGGGAAIWNGIVTIAKVIAPNVWVVMVYVYVAIIAFLIGRKTKK